MSTNFYVFGPVLSGRLGVSLGLDLTGRKICTMDCLYCESGPTEFLTTRRDSYIDKDLFIEELEEFHAQMCAGQAHKPDVLSFAGLGEPTLNVDIEEISARSRKIFPDTPIALLTNSTLFNDPQVRHAAAGLDIVLPSLDSLVEDEFVRINRPHASIALEEIKEGLLAFRSSYKGRIYAEILLLNNLNDSSKNLEELRLFINKLRPDRVDVTTCSRPGAWPEGKPATREALDRFRSALCPLCKNKPINDAEAVKVFSDACSAKTIQEEQNIVAIITQSLKHRPQTLSQLIAAGNFNEKEALAVLGNLIKAGRIVKRRYNEQIFYSFLEE